MAHRKPQVGDKIKILDYCGASWVEKGGVYTISDITSMGELRFYETPHAPSWAHNHDDYEILSEEEPTPTSLKKAKVGDVIRIEDANGADWIEEGGIYTVTLFEDIEDSGDRLYFAETDGYGVWWGSPRHYEILSTGSIQDPLLMKIIDRYPIGTYYLPVINGSISNSVVYRTDIVPKYNSSDSIIGLLGGGLLYDHKDKSKTPLYASIVHKEYRPYETGDRVSIWRDPYESDWDAIGKVSLPSKSGKYVVKESKYCKTGAHIIKLAEFGNWYPSCIFKPVIEKSYTQTKPGTGSLNTNSYGKDKHNQGSSIEVQRPTATIVTGERTSRSGVSGRRDAATIGRRHSSHKEIFGK